MSSHTVFITGGAGYLGSHTAVSLLEAGYRVVIYDNLSSSSSHAIERLRNLTGGDIRLIQGDIRDETTLGRALKDSRPGAVIHLAGLKDMAESVQDPIAYYDHNVSGTATLLRVMAQSGVHRIIFSSTVDIYAKSHSAPCTESHPLSPTNPFGRSVWMAEEILRDVYRANPHWSVGILRCGHPAGAHPSAQIGEQTMAISHNLIPFIAEVAVGRHPSLRVSGNDYPTHDGTEIRDYIHVMDVAEGHLAALRKLDRPRYYTVNLGTGQGHSVLDVVTTFEAVSGRTIPIEFSDRRLADPGLYLADASRAAWLLNWKSRRTLREICADQWRWQSANSQRDALAIAHAA